MLDSTAQARISTYHIVVASACLIAAFNAPPASTAHLEDRAATMIYGGRDRVVALLPADTADLALIVLRQMEGDTVAPSQLTDRRASALRSSATGSGAR